ncbi:DUF4333 domain-containing protein [Streptomyces sp. gb1(2016)]|uniref:DUF4333 domain-containing protein n=1 Tax=Streptomyces sp. gb1(2016) TaxID=1828321 RepID=A0A652KIT7_9ACTN|nr:DUF4333 domain-containing protein [Streptomyces sp. gb1(2016)]TXS23454.1 DUF4333 domain-containing protein [Streptomyces sp. gb1(2016)]
MRNSKLLVALLAAGLLTAGCSSGDGDDGGSHRKSRANHGSGSSSDNDSDGGGSASAPEGDLAVLVDGPQKDVVKSGDERLKVTPKPAPGASFTQQIEHRLRETVLSSTKVPGKPSATCPDGVTQKAGAVSRCTVTYEGAEIPYTITISDSYREGSFITSYKARADKGLLVAKAAYQAFYERYGAGSGRSDASKLSCDELPAAKAVDWGTDTGDTCQFWSEYAGDKGDGGYRTVKLSAAQAGYAVPSFDEVQ